VGAARSRASRRGRRPRRPAKPSANGHPPDSHPRRGQDPSLRAEPLTGAHATPPGRACPAPTVRRPGNGCPRKPRGRFHIPIRRAGCPHPAATSRCRQHPGRDYNPCLPPWGKVAPQGRMRGRLPLPPVLGQTVGGGVSDAPRNLAPTSFPGLPPAEGSRPLPTDRTIDGCLRKPPGRACPAPTVQRNDQFYTTQKGGSHT